MSIIPQYNDVDSGVECYLLCEMRSPFNCESRSNFVVEGLLNGGSIRGWLVNGGFHLDFSSLCNAHVNSEAEL